jgi:hypothetical protein
MFFAAWPALGLAEARAEIAAEPVIEAAGRAVTLWPDDPVRPGGVVIVH